MVVAGVDLDRADAALGDRPRGFDPIEGAVLVAAAVAGGQHHPDLCIAAELGGVRRPTPPHRLPIALATRVADRKSVVQGSGGTLRVYLGATLIIKKKIQHNK